MTDGVPPAGGVGGSFLGVLHEPFVNILERHGVVWCFHQGFVDEFGVWKLHLLVFEVFLILDASTLVPSERVR